MKRSALLIAMFLLLCPARSRAQSNSDSLINGSTCVKIDSSLISFDSSIENNTGWKGIIEERNSFVRKLCGECTKSLVVYIKQIEKIDSVSYIFKLRMRPLRIEVFLASGLCTYKVRIGINRITGRKEIQDAYFSGCQI